jgi:hypothetical protein
VTSKGRRYTRARTSALYAMATRDLAYCWAAGGDGTETVIAAPASIAEGCMGNPTKNIRLRGGSNHT